MKGLFFPSVFFFCGLSAVLAAPGAEVPALFARDTTCTVNSGQGGVCISTSSCSSSGGHSEAGHCPGAADIQVDFCFTFLLSPIS